MFPVLPLPPFPVPWSTPPQGPANTHPREGIAHCVDLAECTCIRCGASIADFGALIEYRKLGRAAKFCCSHILQLHGLQFHALQPYAIKSREFLPTPCSRHSFAPDSQLFCLL